MKRKKDYEILIRRIKSKNTNATQKLRELNDAYTKFLRSRYSDDAIKHVERFILNKYRYVEEPPVEIHDVFLQAAKYYRENGLYDEANDLLDRIDNSHNVNILLQVKMEKELVKIRKAAENGKIDQEALDEIQEITASDDQHELDTVQKGKFTEYDLLMSYFEDIPIETLDSEIFPPSMTKPGTGGQHNIHDPIIPKNGQYIEGLSAIKRLEFFRHNFDIERIRIGKDKFIGTIIFEIKDSDLVIAENFFRVDKGGICIEDYGKATYIIPKEAELDLVLLSRGDLREKIGKEGRLERVNHNSEAYYRNLVDRFNKLQSEQYKKIDIESSKEQSKDDSEIEEIPDPITEENMEQKEKKSNEEFLNELNINLGNIITPSVMEGLLADVNYSFDELYNNTLKNEIMDRLEILDIPEEKREIESQKVFLYMKMTKNMSMITNEVIDENELGNLIDISTLEYNGAIEFYVKHKDDGISYIELINAIKQYIETGKDPLVSEESITGTDDNSEPTKEDYGNLVEEQASAKKAHKAMDIAIRFAKLMERYEQISIQLQRADTIIASKTQKYNDAVQKTIQAKANEEMAKQITRQSVEQEKLAKEDMLDAQDAVSQLKREQDEIQEKLSQIEDLLN